MAGVIMPGTFIRVPLEIEDELVDFGLSPDVPKKEKVGTIRVLKLKRGLQIRVNGKAYEIINIRGSALFCRYKGE